ncbi:MAG: Ivy family c-type lysozyme inhibitor [Syntrophorhabdaceae bacterium]
MKKPVAILMIAIMAIFFSTGLNAQTRKATPGTKSKNKIVVEYVSFPDQYKKYEVYPWDTLKIDDFQRTYAAITKDETFEDWVKTLSGTAANKNRMIRAFKEQFVLIVCCKPHLCDSSQIIVLFDPLKKHVYSVLARDGKFYWFGQPSENVKDLLNILLVEEFKAIYKGER